MIVLLDASPATVRREGARVVVEARDAAPVELSLVDCEAVVVSRATHITPGALAACHRHAVPVVRRERLTPVLLGDPDVLGPGNTDAPGPEKTDAPGSASSDAPGRGAREGRERS